MSISTSTATLFSVDAQHRALFACVGISVALHVLVLFVAPGLRASAPASDSKILTARFALKSASPGPAPVDEPVPRPPEAQPEAPQVKPETPPPVLTQSAPGALAAPQPAAPAPIAPVPSAASTTEVPATSGETAARPAAEAGTLNQYRLALIGAAGRYKRYPVQAMERGWQGRVEIRLAIGADGAIRSASVKTSSGYRILDDQAMDMVKKAKPLTQIPPALRGREFTVDLPVIFDLQTG